MRFSLAFFVSLLLIGLAPSSEAKISGGRCNCPCKITCGSVVCECDAQGNQTVTPTPTVKSKKEKKRKHKCSCSSIEVPVGVGIGIMLDGMKTTTASWLGFEAPEFVQLSIEATSSDSGLDEHFLLSMTHDPVDPLFYEPTVGNDRAAFASFVASSDTSRGWTLYGAFLRDPSTYRILDGDPSHLTESMNVGYYARKPGGGWQRLGGSDNTLLWEMVTYLDGVIAQVDDHAFRSAHDAGQTRSVLYAAVDTMELLVNAAAYDRAQSTLKDAIKQLELQLAPDHPSTRPTLAAFDVMQRLLETDDNTRISAAHQTAR